MGKQPAAPAGSQDRERGEAVSAMNRRRRIVESADATQFVSSAYQDERTILEMTATGAPLQDILDAIVRSLERQIPDSMASVLLLDDERKHLLHGSAPSLPLDYCSAIHGAAIGPSVGSCGTAAYLNEIVIVEDTYSDPKWAQFRVLAVEHGLRACWSHPIRDTAGAPIGTFAVYHRHVTRPSSHQLAVAKTGAHLAAVAIENRRASETMMRHAKRMEIAEQVAHFGIWEVDLLRDRVIGSKNFYQLLGADSTLESLPMQAWFDLVHPDDRTAMIAAWRYTLGATGRSWRYEFRLAQHCALGQWCRVEGKIERDSGGKPLRMIGTTQNITAERDLTQRQHQAKQSAEEAARVKSAFLANMSHEIRTPLHGIIGSIDLLANCESFEEQREYLDTIRTSGDSLMQIVDDILDFSKIEAGKIELEYRPFSLTKLMGAVQSIVAPQARRKGLSIEFQCPHECQQRYLGDSFRLQQVLLNLVSNAVKFTPHGLITVRLECDSARQTFTVRDTGIGMDPKLRDAIFQPFTQADSSTTRRYGGTGLGLSISRHLVELMGGELLCRSELGVGTTFSFALAMPPALTGVVEPAVATSPDRCSRSLHILVAEDNLINQRVATNLLKRLGHTVQIAADGRQAVLAAQQTQFDLILMDRQMPEMDGLDAARELRRQGNPVYITALTASTLAEDRDLCLEAGMNDYLSKPITLHRLRQSVETTIQAIQGSAGRY